MYVRPRHRVTKLTRKGRKNVMICPHKECRVLPETITSFQMFKDWWLVTYGIGKWSLVNKTKRKKWIRVARFEVKRNGEFTGDFRNLQNAIKRQKREQDYKRECELIDRFLDR